MDKFIVTFFDAETATTRREVTEYDNKHYAQDKARELRMIFTKVKVVPATLATRALPTICD